MEYKGFRSKRLDEAGQKRAHAGRDRLRRERGTLASSFRTSLEAQYRASVGAPEAPLSATVEALLSAAVSAHVEISVTTERFLQGRARDKALERLANTRGELRRCLRALNLIGDSGESAAPPAGPTLEELKAKYEPREVAS